MKPTLFRHVVKYTKNPWHDTHYGDPFEDLRSSTIHLRTVAWHVGAKCAGNGFAIASITLECKEEGIAWRPVE